MPDSWPEEYPDHWKQTHQFRSSTDKKIIGNYTQNKTLGLYEKLVSSDESDKVDQQDGFPVTVGQPEQAQNPFFAS